MPDFVSDGCTLWFDGWPRWLGGTADEWVHCCIDHDLAGNSLESSIVLGACVAQTPGGWIMAGLMVTGTALWLLTRRANRRRP